MPKARELFTIEESVEELIAPRRDKDVTFTAFDVIRIGVLNLEKEELRSVILFFMVGVPLILSLESLSIILFSIKIPKTAIKLFEFLLKGLVGKSIIQILLFLGFEIKLNDIVVVDRIVRRLNKLFPPL